MSWEIREQADEHGRASEGPQQPAGPGSCARSGHNPLCISGRHCESPAQRALSPQHAGEEHSSAARGLSVCPCPSPDTRVPLHGRAFRSVPVRSACPSWEGGGSGTPAQAGAAGNSWPPAFFHTNRRKRNVLSSSPHTPVRSTWLLVVLPVAAPSVSFAIDGTLMQSGSFCPPSFKDSIYYECISLRGLGLGPDKEICNHRTHLN